MDDVSRGNLLAHKIARTLVRAWIEKEMGEVFGLDRQGVKPSLQIGVNPSRPLPSVSLKWNETTAGITNRLRIEEATIRYLEKRMRAWGNNRSPNNDYVAGSTSSKGFDTPFKTVYFDHLVKRRGSIVAHEAFTGLTPGAGDIEGWLFLSKEGVIRPGMIINFQNEVGQSISEKNTRKLAGAGYQISVVPYAWWSCCCLSPDLLIDPPRSMTQP